MNTANLSPCRWTKNPLLVYWMADISFGLKRSWCSYPPIEIRTLENLLGECPVYIGYVEVDGNHGRFLFEGTNVLTWDVVYVHRIVEEGTCNTFAVLVHVSFVGDKNGKKVGGKDKDGQENTPKLPHNNRLQR